MSADNEIAVIRAPHDKVIWVGMVFGCPGSQDIAEHIDPDNMVRFPESWREAAEHFAEWLHDKESVVEYGICHYTLGGIECLNDS